MTRFAALLLVLAGAAPREEIDRSPSDLALSPDGRWVLTANTTSDSVSLVDLQEKRVAAEVAVGRRPRSLAWSGTRAIATNGLDDTATILEVDPPRLAARKTVPVGDEPRGVAIAGALAHVALSGEDAVAVLDLEAGRVLAKIAVGDEPWHLAVTRDGRRLAVGNALSGDVSVVDAEARRVQYTVSLGGRNLRHVAIDPEGAWAYVPHIASERGLPPTRPNIERAGVLANRLSRVSLLGEAPAETVALDQDGYAMADLDGLALSPDGTIALAVGGTKDVATLGPPLPWVKGGKTRDHIDPALYKDRTRFRRIHTRGRLTGLAYLPDGKRMVVANYLGNEVQVVDPAKDDIEFAVSLGGPREASLARRGEAIFYDASRSWHEWYSCHTCHVDGHTNGGVYDTFNDGKTGNPKKVLSLRGVSRTGPWTWHGHQKDLGAALQGSFTRTMAREALSRDELRAVTAYLQTLDFAPPAGPKDEAARRGEELFKARGCESCHSAPDYTSDEVASVGLESPDDAFQGFNPPPLRGVWTRGPWLHDGRAKSLDEVLKTHHRPQKLGGKPDFTDAERADVLAFLRSL